jgi:hypothetical protein
MARIEAYEMVTINRAAIKNAPYNPRKITRAAREKLRKGLEAHGLVVPLTWNRRTGNLVSGHQRIARIDQIEGNTAYTLQVAAIDVDEKREKEINILLNNQAAMGEFDYDKLGGLLEEVDYSLAGFGEEDLSELLGGGVDDLLTDEDVEKRRDKYDEGIAHRKRMAEASFRENNIEFYTALVFPDKGRRAEFFALLGVKDALIVNGVEIMEAVRAKINGR